MINWNLLVHFILGVLTSKDRWKERSRAYAGIAQAMADQWGKLI